MCMHKYNLLEHMYNRYHINTMLAGGGGGGGGGGYNRVLA